MNYFNILKKLALLLCFVLLFSMISCGDDRIKVVSFEDGKEDREKVVHSYLKEALKLTQTV